MKLPPPNLEEELKKSSEADLIQKLETVKTSAKSFWTPVMLRWYTDHGPEHSQTVITLIADIIKPLYYPNENPGFHLNKHELFVLLAACHLHDIGMQDLNLWKDELNNQEIDLENLTPSDYKTIRKRHPEWSAKLIAEHFNKELGERYLVPVKNVSRAHGTDYYKDLLNNGDYKEKAVVGSEKIRGHFLASLLLMGDELDLQKGRVDHNVDEISKKLGEYPPESLLHIYKHYFINEAKISDNPDNSPRERNIEVYFRFPQDSGKYADEIINWVWYKLRSQCQATQEILWNSVGLRWGKVKVKVDSPCDCKTLPPEALSYLRKETRELRLINREALLKKIKDYLDNPAPGNEVLLVWGEEESDSGAISEWLEEYGKCCPGLQSRHLDFADEESRGQSYIIPKTEPLLDTKDPGFLLISDLQHVLDSAQKWLWTQWLPKLLSPEKRNVAIVLGEGPPPATHGTPLQVLFFPLARFNREQVAEHLVEKLGCPKEEAQQWVDYIEPSNLPAAKVFEIVGLYRRGLEGKRFI